MNEFKDGKERLFGSFSEKFLKRAKAPIYRGAIFDQDAGNAALTVASFKSVKLYCLVDVEKNSIIEAKYFCYGDSITSVTSDILCEKISGAQILSTNHINAADLEYSLRDEPETKSVPEDQLGKLLFVPHLLKALEKAYPAAKALALAKKVSSAKQDDFDYEEADADWKKMSSIEKMLKIESVLDEAVRPGLIADGGNIEVLDLYQDTKVIIAYQGNCGACGASTGGTLHFIEDQLKNRLYHRISVFPEDLAPSDWIENQKAG